jgi:predicted nucleic acid-binding protein
MNLVGANVFIRYLIGDDPAKQQQSRDLIERIDSGKSAEIPRLSLKQRHSFGHATG